MKRFFILPILGGCSLLFATNASAAVLAVANGDAQLGATWAGGVAPTSGDTETWNTNGFNLNFPGTNNRTDTFNGQTLLVSTNSVLSGAVGLTLNLNNLTLGGGRITHLNNTAMSYNLGGKTLGLNSGEIQSGAAAGRDITFSNFNLAGAGNITISGSGTTGSQIIWTGTNTTTGFTGNLNISGAGIFDTKFAINTATFGMTIVGANSRYVLRNSLALTSLVIDGDTIAAGTYSFGDFSAKSQALLTNQGGTITVVPEPSSAALLGLAGLALIVRRRR